MDRNEAEERYGFRIYQGGVPMEARLRIVEIDGWDVEACFGTHLTNTGEVGAVKIVRAERIQDGVVRLEYVAGTRVAEEASRLQGIIEEASKLLGGHGEDLPQRLRSTLQHQERLEEGLKAYREHYTSQLLERASRARRAGAYRILAFTVPERDRRVAQEMLRKLTSAHPDLVAAAIIPGDSSVVAEIALGREAAERLDAGALAGRLAERLGGRGGGRGPRASLTLPSIDPESLEEALAGVVLEESGTP